MKCFVIKSDLMSSPDSSDLLPMAPCINFIMKIIIQSLLNILGVFILIALDLSIFLHIYSFILFIFKISSFMKKYLLCTKRFFIILDLKIFDFEINFVVQIYLFLVLRVLIYQGLRCFTISTKEYNIVHICLIFSIFVHCNF